MFNMQNKWKISLPAGRLARNTYAGTILLMARVAGQMIWTILIARILGPSGYGLLSGITALGATLGTLTGLGFGVLLLQETSRDTNRLSALWTQSVAISIISGLILLLPFSLLGPSLLSVPGEYLIFIAIGLTEILCFPIVIIASQAFQAKEKLAWSGIALWLPTLGNLLALGIFILGASERSILEYAPYHVAGAIFSSLSALLLVRIILNPTRTELRISCRQLQEGVGFCAIRLADNAQVSLDKVLVLRIIDSQAAGIYTVAYRLVSVATVPLVALSMSVLPRLFRFGGDSQANTRPLVRRLLLAVVAYGILAAVAILFASNLIPLLLGPKFHSAAEIARWLAISPFLQGLYIIGANILMTHGGRNYRLAVQCICVLAMTISAAILLPAFGLKGAASMLLITQCMMTALVWKGAIRMLRTKALSPS